MSWIWKLLAAIVVWVLVGLLVAFVGTLLLTVDQETIRTLGDFLKDNSGLLGFLAGVAYFIWGRIPGKTA